MLERVGCKEMRTLAHPVLHRWRSCVQRHATRPQEIFGTVMLVSNRLEAAQRLPALPNELWMHAMSFVLPPGPLPDTHCRRERRGAAPGQHGGALGAVSHVLFFQIVYFVSKFFMQIKPDMTLRAVAIVALVALGAGGEASQTTCCTGCVNGTEGNCFTNAGNENVRVRVCFRGNYTPGLQSCMTDDDSNRFGSVCSSNGINTPVPPSDLSDIQDKSLHNCTVPTTAAHARPTTASTINVSKWFSDRGLPLYECFEDTQYRGPIKMVAIKSYNDGNDRHPNAEDFLKSIDNVTTRECANHCNNLPKRRMLPIFGTVWVQLLCVQQ